MPFRFRRSIYIVPGIRVNVGKHGLSTSVGVRGAHITVAGGPGVRATATLPGTGISYTVTTPHGGAGSRRPPGSWRRWLICTAIVAAGAWWFGWL